MRLRRGHGAGHRLDQQGQGPARRLRESASDSDSRPISPSGPSHGLVPHSKSRPRCTRDSLRPRSTTTQRIFAFQEWNWTFGLTLLAGRVKIATVLGDRQKSMLKGQKPTSDVLVKRRDGGYFLHVQLTATGPRADPAQRLHRRGPGCQEPGDRQRRRDLQRSRRRAGPSEVRSHSPDLPEAPNQISQAQASQGSHEGVRLPEGPEPRHQQATHRQGQGTKLADRPRRPRGHRRADDRTRPIGVDSRVGHSISFGAS